MADTNQNRGTYRGSNQDRDEYGNRYGRNDREDRGYSSRSSYGNRDYENSGSSNRNLYDEGESFGSSSGRYGREEDENYERGNYGGRSYRESDQDYGGRYSNRARESNYERGYGSPWGSSTSSNFGSSYNRGGYQDEYGNRGNYRRNFGEANQGYYGGGQRTYGQEGYGNRYGSSYYGSGGRDQDQERGWWDRTTDEVSSWFGNEEAERRREQDRRREGLHRGKGPKGYQRSDERIKEDINDRLSDDAFVDASSIEVMVESGEVTLTGTVGDRSEKRRAEDLAEAVSGVRNVENRLRVGQDVSADRYKQGTSQSGTTTGAEKSKARQPMTTG
jgi:osmotically-inducible protein OsmY